ncbi:hypothetical protein [Roseimaritima ulvae]|uniref:Uncharacterized protein n=1 Tax=Roseimaritima ulvae TaxID=980254 RepID=A0A5B9QM67_9BACT|nr:hypothetical protein [Roseimaritima ulvae]QEG38932.1 hypothetical protein UC8_08920 [Roseimaritima ulvae]
MSDFYRYEKKQRRTAITLLFNMLVLLLMYGAARALIEPSEEAEQLFFWMNIALPVVELVLLLGALFFWIQNGTFRVSVDAERFEIVDPLFKDFSFSVPVSEIVEIRQTHQKHHNYSSIMMCMQSGEKHQITQNYRYHRGKLYAALAKANADIQLPKHAYRSKQV